MKRIILILISTVSAFIIMSSGYGLWNKELIVVGNIEIRPTPEINYQPIGGTPLIEQQSNNPEISNENKEDQNEGQDTNNQSEIVISGEEQQNQGQENVIESSEPVVFVEEVHSSIQTEANTSND